MDNPWTQKGRLFWKKDPLFQEFNEQMYTEKFLSFSNVFEFSTASEWPWSDKDWIPNVSKHWNNLCNRWKSHTKSTKLPGFAAITLLFAVLPYDKLGQKLGTVLTEFESNHINAAYFYEIGQYHNGKENLQIQNLEDLTGGPLYPPAYEQWINQKYNMASWWLTYMVYERKNNLSPVIDSAPAKLINK